MRIVSSKSSISIDTLSSNLSFLRLLIRPTNFIHVSPPFALLQSHFLKSNLFKIFGTFQDLMFPSLLILHIFNKIKTIINSLTNNIYKMITNKLSFYSNFIRKTKAIINRSIMIFGEPLKLMKMVNVVYSWEWRE